jgi:hypothetical protein
LLLSAVAVDAEMRKFTDLKGRTLNAELLDANETTIQLKLKNCKSAKVEILLLSESDQSYVKEWVKQRELKSRNQAEDEAAKKRAAEIPVNMEAYCKRQLGKQVGNGECWTLADEAFKACNLQRPGGDGRVWGRLLDLKKDKVQAGDIVEFRSAKFSNGFFTGPEHTAVVVKGGRRGIVVAEQNWGGNKTVRENEIDPNSLISGKIMVYRPE